MFFSRNNKNNWTSDLSVLIDDCKRNNSLAQKELIRQFLGYAKSICRRYANNEQEMEEIINDSFYKVFKNLDKFDFSKPFKAWFRTIVINTSIDFFHRYNKHKYEESIENHDFVDLNYDVIQKLSADEIMKLVQQLSPSYRMVFTLYVIEGYTHKEIADILQIKEGTSKSNLQDARNKLQHLIYKRYPEFGKQYSLKITKTHEK